MEDKNADFGTVKVDTSVLQAKGEDAYQKLQNYQAALERIQALIMESSSFWIGQAGELYRSSMQNQIKQAMETVQVFLEYPKELLEYAGIYSETIRRTEELAQSVGTLDMF